MKTTMINLKLIAITITLAVVFTLIPQVGTLVKADTANKKTQPVSTSVTADISSTETNILEAEKGVTVSDVINHKSPKEDVEAEAEAEVGEEKKVDKKITKKIKPNKITATATTPKKKYTSDQIEMIQYVVQNEAGYMNKKHKQIITEVILNRVASKKFPNTIKGVLSQRGQFTSWRNYLNRTNPPIKSTKDAVMSVLNGDVTGVSKGALFFYAPKLTSNSSTRNWFERQTFVIQLSETLWGVTYTHRFFK